MDAFWYGVRLLLVLTVANTSPILLKRVLGSRGALPIDFGRNFVDGRPWLGASKTWRGLAAAVLASGAIAPLLGIPFLVGASLGLLAMAGDAMSSFVKRRLDIAPSGRAFGIDQLPESLLPLLVMQHALDISWPILAGVVLAFLVLETPAARLWHRLGLREHPY